MKLSKEARKVSRELFQGSFKDGKLDPVSIRTITAKVADSKPRHYMEILKNYQRLIRLEIEKHHAVIESAETLDSDFSEQLAKSLRGKHGQDLSTEFKVNPELLGGMRIKLGSTVWDSSVIGRLNRLQNQLAHV